MTPMEQAWEAVVASKDKLNIYDHRLNELRAKSASIRRAHAAHKHQRSVALAMGSDDPPTPPPEADLTGFEEAFKAAQSVINDELKNLDYLTGKYRGHVVQHLKYAQTAAAQNLHSAFTAFVEAYVQLKAADVVVTQATSIDATVLTPWADFQIKPITQQQPSEAGIFAETAKHLMDNGTIEQRVRALRSTLLAQTPGGLP